MQHRVKCFLSKCCVLNAGSGRMQKISSEESGSAQPNIGRYIFWYSRYHNNHSCWQPERQRRKPYCVSCKVCVCNVCKTQFVFFKHCCPRCCKGVFVPDFFKCFHTAAAVVAAVLWAMQNMFNHATAPHFVRTCTCVCVQACHSVIVRVTWLALCTVIMVQLPPHSSKTWTTEAPGHRD